MNEGTQKLRVAERHFSQYAYRQQQKIKRQAF